MHRQSLGSPVSKEEQQKKLLSPSSSPATGYLSGDDKPKPVKPSSPPPSSSSSLSSSKPDAVIHVIPLLTFFCFFILYLFSHTPSPSELAQFGGRFNPLITTNQNGDEAGRFTETVNKGGDVLAVRSARNLQQVVKRLGRTHRKFADF